MNQSGFVRGRLILDNYILNKEMISDIKRKARGGNVVLKVDMMKDDDRMMWSFMIKVLRAFGCKDCWIEQV